VLKIVDLSLAIDADTQVYPGDPHVKFTVAATIEKDGFNLVQLDMGSQNGTNCDAPYHFLASGARIDEVALDLFAGPAVIIDVRHRQAREKITVADVEPYLADLGPGVIAVFFTGWSQYYQSAAYLDHPYLGAEACTLLLDHGVLTFCLDVLNIDETPDDEHPGEGWPAHLLVARAGGVVVENLAAIEKIDFPDPFVTVFPLPLTGADGSPTRAVAMRLSGPAVSSGSREVRCVHDTPYQHLAEPSFCERQPSFLLQLPDPSQASLLSPRSHPPSAPDSTPQLVLRRSRRGRS
jgi:kynurenine formamidase